MKWRFKYYDVDKGPNWDALNANCHWFKELKSVPQDAIWHAEGNVQVHTKMVCEAIIIQPEFLALSDYEKHIMFCAALFHDIEKRSTTIEEMRDGRMCITAPSHARRGEGVTREMLYTEYNCPYDAREQIAKYVRYHGRPLYSLDDDNSEEQMIKLSYQVASLKMLAMLSRADILGRECFDKQEQLEKTQYFELYAQDLGCFDNPYQFPNKITQYKFLSSNGVEKTYEAFDETKFEVVLMSAIAGAGKDTYIKRNYAEWPVISLDAIREEMKVKPTDKSGNGRVIQEAKERAKQYMRKRQNFVWNGTNITSQLRKQLVDLFVSYGGMVTIVYVEVPYQTLLTQNSSRQAEVPTDVVNKMVRKLEPPTAGEAQKIILHV